MLKVRKIVFKTALRFRKIERSETKRDKKHSNAFSWILIGSALFCCYGNVMLDQFDERGLCKHTRRS